MVQFVKLYFINKVKNTMKGFSALGLGSVEGLAYEAVGNTLYWTCNNDATINRANLTGGTLKPETVIKLGPSDKPRGIAIDTCEW